MIERFRGSVLKAVRHFEQALSIEPDSRDVLMWLAVCFSWEVGRSRAAIQLARRLLQIDPLTPFNHAILGFALWMDGQLDRALAAFGKNHEQEPESIIPGMWMAFILMWKNHYQDAFDLIDDLTRQQYPDQMRRIFSEFLQFSKLAVQKNTDQAKATLSDGLREYAWVDPDLPWMMAGLYSVMDEKEEAYRWLDHAIDRGWINYPLFAERDPFYENLRGDERFEKLMNRIKPEWERFEVGIDLSSLPPESDG
jgi:non-specific serine/threonine protein kinase